MSELSINPPTSWKSRLDLLATILLVLVTMMVGAFALLDRFRPEPLPKTISAKPVRTSTKIGIGDSPVKGSSEAKVAVVLFSEFECPFCGRATREILPELQTRYIDTGKVLLVWRHYPLRIHPAARGAAEAAECGRRQGQFWNLHNWAFAHQRVLPTMRDEATRLGLDMDAFDKCVGGEASEAITSDLALAEELGVQGTPTWFIGAIESNGTVKPVDRIDGLGPVEAYTKTIDKLVLAR